MRARASRETRVLDNSLKLFQGLVQCNASGGELLVIVLGIGVHVLYNEEGFKRRVRRMRGLGI
jgi:hypothetical protein